MSWNMMTILRYTTGISQFSVSVVGQVSIVTSPIISQWETEQTLPVTSLSYIQFQLQLTTV